MSFTHSPEIEAVARRVLATWGQGDAKTMSNLFSSSADLRVLGFDADEQWSGADEFLEGAAKGGWSAPQPELDWVMGGRTPTVRLLKLITFQ